MGAASRFPKEKELHMKAILIAAVGAAVLLSPVAASARPHHWPHHHWRAHHWVHHHRMMHRHHH
jgi:hypothetical protein